MIDPWGLVIVLALGCAYLIWYGLRMGWRLHDAQIEIAMLQDRLRPRPVQPGYDHPDAPKHPSVNLSSESFTPEFKLGCVTPEGFIWTAPGVKHSRGMVAVAEGEREKAEFFGWTWAGWDGKNQLNLMRRN